MKKALVPTLVALGILIAVAVGVFVYISASSGQSEATDTEPTSTVASSTVADDSHFIDEAGADAVTIVEFLDFECGACGQFYHYVEEVRKHYDGDINYVVRYFPLPNHPNSMDAAIAAEAAAQQGEFEAMYHRLFQNQAQWGGGTAPQTDVFRSYAADIGLDLDAYDVSVADPATRERVVADFEAGGNLGVNSTPTFFINDEVLELQRLEDLPEAIDAHLGR